MIKRLTIIGAALVFMGGAYIGATGAFFSDSETSNGNVFTAGAITLAVDSTQHYNNAVCVSGDGSSTWQLAPGASAQPDQYPVIGSTCTGTWTATKLGPSNQFFNFTDIKPADSGEDTISMDLQGSNPAWACADIALTNNSNATTTAPAFDGALANELQVYAWEDSASTSGAIAGDNIHQAGEPTLFGPESLATLLGSGAAAGTSTVPLADATTGTGPLAGGSSSYIGLAWCAGMMSVNSGTGAVTCDGSSMGNEAQLNSLSANITLRLSQSRNQPNFTCSAGGTVGGPTTVVVGADDLATSPTDVAANPTKWYIYDDTGDVINNSLATFVTGPATPPNGTGSVQLIATSSLFRADIATTHFDGTKLSTITQLSTSLYGTSGAWSASEAPFAFLDVDFIGGSVTYQHRLTYVPADNGAVSQNAWQTSDLINGGNALWEYPNNTWPATAVGPDAGGSPESGNTPRKWSAILLDYPNIQVFGAGQMGVRVGEPGPAGFQGNINSFTIATGGAATTYEF